MESTNLNIRIDKEVKANAEKIFDELGLTLTAAVTIFLKKTIRENGVPFDLKLDTPNIETIAAIKEGRLIAHDSTVKGYKSIEELRADLDI